MSGRERERKGESFINACRELAQQTMEWGSPNAMQMDRAQPRLVGKKQERRRALDGQKEAR